MFKPQGWQRSTRLLAVSSVLLLAACGGGGGGSSSGGSGSGVTYTVTPTVGAHGAISPNGPQQVPENGSITFNVTPDSGYKIKSSLSISGDSCFSKATPNVSTSTGVYTFSHLSGDCSFSVDFEQLTHTVTAKVASGDLLPMTTASVTTAQTPDFLALDAANSQAYVVKTDGVNGAIAVHAIDTSGELASAAAATLDAPYISVGCSKLGSGAALSSRCLVVGTQGNAAGHAYAILDKTCTSPTACTDVPTIRVYNTTSGTLTNAVDTDLAAGFSTVSFNSVTAIAISPSTNRLALTGVVQINGGVPQPMVFLYAVGADGKLTSLSGQPNPVGFEDAVLGNVVADPATSNIYVSYQLSSATSGSDMAGVFQFVIDSNSGTLDHLSPQMEYHASGDDTVTADFVINGADAYMVVSHVGTDSKTTLTHYTINAATGDLTAAGSQLSLSSSFDNIDGVALHLGQTGDTGYLLVKSFASAGDAGNRTAVSRVDIGASGTLTVGDELASVAGDATHNLVIDAAGAHAYLTNPDQPAISQYWISAAHGTVDPATQNVNEGSTATVTVTSDANYKAVVSDDGCNGAFNETTGEYGIANVTADCTVTATFVAE